MMASAFEIRAKHNPWRFERTSAFRMRAAAFYHAKSDLRFLLLGKAARLLACPARLKGRRRAGRCGTAFHFGYFSLQNRAIPALARLTAGIGQCEHLAPRALSARARGARCVPPSEDR